jgi:hypothetical protein
MSTKLQAYFETENVALQVKEQLIKFNVSNLEIGKLEDDGPDDNIPLGVPIITGGTAQVNNGILGGFPVIAEDEQRTFHVDQYTIYRVVLSGEVSAEYYD